ncbi:hypothetical protein L2E82_52084 [Cichorium intybus]|nr:hypothetical protein L2E82_52084 [Cichorium intybus]
MWNPFQHHDEDSMIKRKGGVLVGHILSGYSLPMEENGELKDIKGTWKHAIKASYDATVEAFPGGEIIAHLDQK